MDLAKVTLPPYIGKRDSGLGYGELVWMLFGDGVKVQGGVDAVLAVYPNAFVTDSRIEAFKILRQAS